MENKKDEVAVIKRIRSDTLVSINQLDITDKKQNINDNYSSSNINNNNNNKIDDKNQKIQRLKIIYIIIYFVIIISVEFL